MIDRDQLDELLTDIGEPMTTDEEWASVDAGGELYAQTAKLIQTFRGGIGAAFEKLAAKAKLNGINLDKKQWSNVYIGGVLD
jgi:hypothetical protein